MDHLKKFIQSSYVLVFFFFLLNLLIYGYDYGNNSYHDYILPYINKLINPALYPQDPYLQTLHSFPSLYIYLMAFLGKIFPIESAHFFLYLITKLLTFAALYLLSRQILNNRWGIVLSLSFFAASPMVNSFGLLSDEPLIKFFLYQSFFVVPFLLFTLYFFLRKKYLLCFLILGLSFYFGALQTGYVAFMLLAASLTALKEGKKDFKSSLFLPWLLFFLICLPMVLCAQLALQNQTSSAEFLAYLRNYYAGHYFPLSWPAAKWLRVLINFCFFIFFLVQAPNDKNRKTIRVFCRAIFVLWGTAFVSGEIIPFKPLVVLMLLRSDIFFLVFALIYAADYLQKLIFAKDNRYPLTALVTILAFTNIGLYFSVESLVLILAVFFLSVAAFGDIPFAQHERQKKALSILYRVALTGLFAYSTAQVFFLGQQIKTYLLMAVAALFLLLASGKTFASADENKKPVIFYLILLLVLLPHSDLIWYRLKAASLTYQTPLRKNWQDIQRWAKNNSPVDALFIVPPYINGFRSFSQRPVFVEKIDGGAMHWAPGFETLWAKRLGELGYGRIPFLHFDDLNPNDALTTSTRLVYARLPEEKIARLAAAYHAGYIVEERFRTLSFPLAYKNDLFSVYRIPK